MPLGKPTKPLKKACADTPCPSCPYRKDTPLGVWAPDHYEALLAYDGDTGEQVEKGAFGAFGCHQDNGLYCRGWIDTHGAGNLFALRLHGLSHDPGPPTVEVYASAKECYDANLPHLPAPGPEAQALQAKLLKHPCIKNYNTPSKARKR
jgi:hypothetical protein